MLNFKAFTLTGDGILPALKTECGICEAFDPLENKTHPPIIHFTALWDTGASNTVISKNVVDQLSLKPSGKSKVYHANGESTVNSYQVNLFLPNQVAFQFMRVTEGILTDFDMLIGMDIICTGDLCITNFQGKTIMTFRIPSQSGIDYVSEWNKRNFVRNKYTKKGNK